MRNGALIARAVVDVRSLNQAKTDGSAYTRELGIKPIEVRCAEDEPAVKKKRFRLVVLTVCLPCARVVGFSATAGAGVEAVAAWSLILAKVQGDFC